MTEARFRHSWNEQKKNRMLKFLIAGHPIIGVILTHINNLKFLACSIKVCRMCISCIHLPILYYLRYAPCFLFHVPSSLLFRSLSLSSSSSSSPPPFFFSTFLSFCSLFWFPHPRSWGRLKVH